MGDLFYDIGHASVNSYVPASSVNDIPAGAYIMQLPFSVAKHDSAVPTAVVPLGHDVAMVMYGASIDIYPVGHSSKSSIFPQTP